MSQERTFWRRGTCLILITLSFLLVTSRKILGQSHIVISQYIETSSGYSPKGIELWNPTDAPIDFSVDTLTIWKGTNGKPLKIKATIGKGLLQSHAVMVIGTSDIEDSLMAHGLEDVLFDEVPFTFNGDDALQIQLGDTVEDTFGKPGNDPGSSWDGNGVSTKSSNIGLKDGITTGSPDGFMDPSVRFQTVSTDNSLTGFGLPPGGAVTTGPKPEPSDTARFNAPVVTTHSITLHWTDASGDVPPDGYLIKVTDENPDSIRQPIDGTPETDDSDLSDGYGAANVTRGTGTITWNGLLADTTYYFRMFSFTNSGSNINYKTDQYASLRVTTKKEPASGSGTAIRAVINEFHYDNAGADSNEFVEVAADTSVEASKLELLLYNGHGGGIYNTSGLSEFTVGERQGRWQFYSKEYSSIQNGPDGMALVYHFDDRDTVLQFISYEGSFVATEGAANGMHSNEIDADESSKTDLGMSLGLSGILTGDGKTVVWAPMPATPGKMNDRESIYLKTDTLLSRTVITGDAGWRMLSSPVTGLTFADLEQVTPIQGYPGASPGNDKNFYSGYDGTAWTFPSDLSESMKNGHGFILYFFNNDKNGSRKLPIDFDIAGGLQANSVTIPLHENGDGFNLVGNPFPEYIDMSNITPNGGNLASEVAQIWDGSTDSYILSTEQGDRIAPFQGFFLQNKDAVSLTFQSNNTITEPTTPKITGVTGKPAIIGFRISDADSASNGVLDEAAALYFGSDAIAGWDKWDVQKLTPLQSDYAILSIKGTKDGQTVLKAEESQPLNLTQPVSFKLTISGSKASGNRVLQWPVWKNIPDSWNIELKDLKTNQVIDMRTDSLCRFSIGETQVKTSSVHTALLHISGAKISDIPSARFEVTITPTLTGIENSSLKPHRTKLSQNYPNPFNPTTDIRFFLPQTMKVKLTIYDILGRRVGVLVNGNTTSGWHTVSWRAGSLASGVYFYRLETPGKVLVKKMLFLK